MLIDGAYRYIELRRSLGFKLRKTSIHLTSFVEYAANAGEAHVRTDTALAGAKAMSSTQDSFYRRLRDVALFARFLQAEDTRHEVPQHRLFYRSQSRPAPYIFSADEVVRILAAACSLRATRLNPLKPGTYEMLFGLLAATGLRISEALKLRLDDVLADGMLHIRATKFNKDRLVPLHPTVVAKLDAHLRVRERYYGNFEGHLFLTECGRPLPSGTARTAFHTLLRHARIAPDRPRRPRMHDLRHTFATRVLEQCAAGRDEVARDFVALSTYLGHGDIKHTYWYLEATPGLMGDIAAAAEMLVAERRV
jgi:integrase/recombinase XerD